LGGEEFALVLEDHRLDQAFEVAERLRRTVSALKFETGRGAMTLTCSFGVGAWEPGDTIDDLLKRADVALYAAKTGGRHRVIGPDAARPIEAAPISQFVRSAARG